MKQIKKWIVAWGSSLVMVSTILQPVIPILASEPVLVAGDSVEISAAVEAAAQPGPEIAAPSAILMEASTGQVVYEKNADESRSPASITKIMTLILIFDALESGRIKMTDEVITSAYAKSMGGSQVFLEAGTIIGLNIVPAFLFYRKLRPTKQKPSRGCTHKKNGCWCRRALARESGSPDSLLYTGVSREKFPPRFN